jgi:hypothetical protein
MTKLICPECQRENEPERIFCHGCGARLDRSALVASKTAEEKPKQTHRRVQQLFDPRRGRLRRTVFRFCQLTLAALVTATLVQMILPPEAPPATQTVGVSAQINFDLENAILYHRQLQYSQEEVNAYLAYALKSKQSALNKPLLSFKRAVVTFGEGTCTIMAERSFFNYPLYQRAIYGVNVAEGKIVVSAKGGFVGRLPIHPVIMRYTGIIFADLWSALAREQKLVAQMDKVEFHEGNVLLSASR